MKKEEIKNLYEELVQDRPAYEDDLKTYPVAKIEKLVNALGVFEQPIAAVLQMSQDDYAQKLSDGHFSFDYSNHVVGELLDRIIISHTDGSVKDHQLKLDYRHEDPYDSGQYNLKTDFNIIQYDLAIIAAVASVLDIDQIKEILSPDAAVSLMLAANAIKETGRG